MAIARGTLVTPTQAIPCLQAAVGPRRALLLHGFPDTPWSMVPLMAAMARRGWRTWAPWMPGYDPAVAGTPTIHGLAAFVGELLDALGPDDDVLVVGHDWGAVGAPPRLRSTRPATIVAAAVPPTRGHDAAPAPR